MQQSTHARYSCVNSRIPPVKVLLCSTVRSSIDSGATALFTFYETSSLCQIDITFLDNNSYYTGLQDLGCRIHEVWLCTRPSKSKQRCTVETACCCDWQNCHSVSSTIICSQTLQNVIIILPHFAGSQTERYSIY